MLSFRDFERSEQFSRQKSRFFRSGLQLPQACDRSRSERENHGFSAITSSKSVFRDIYMIFVGSPSRIFFEAPPNLSARAKKSSKGAPSFAERDYRENPCPDTRAGISNEISRKSAKLRTAHDFRGHLAAERGPRKAPPKGPATIRSLPKS